jgi:hypothetical protein
MLFLKTPRKNPLLMALEGFSNTATTFSALQTEHATHEKHFPFNLETTDVPSKDARDEPLPSNITPIPPTQRHTQIRAPPH